MPKKMNLAMKSLGLEDEKISFGELIPGNLESGTELPNPKPLFPKKTESVLKEKFEKLSFGDL